MANFTGTTGNNTHAGDNTNQTITGDPGPNVVANINSQSQSASFGFGADNLSGAGGNDVIYGDAQFNSTYFFELDTTLVGMAKDFSANMQIFSGITGRDTIEGGAGADTIYAGAGSDRIIVDTAGDGYGDVVYGGESATFQLQVTFLKAKDSSLLSVTTVSITNNDDFDVLDLTGSGNGPGTRVEVVSTGAEQGIVIWRDRNDTTLGTLRYFDVEQVIVPCLTAGTLVTTDKGERLVEDLEAGDMVMTVDHGLQPVRWIGKRNVEGQGEFTPIRIKAGALGNDRDLVVSPLHRMMIRNAHTDLLFGESEVLVPAKFMVNGTTIVEEPCDEITYVHVLFEQHELIYAEGAVTESFYPGQQGVGALEDETRQELFNLFPELVGLLGTETYGPTARTVLKKYEADVLMGA